MVKDGIQVFIYWADELAFLKMNLLMFDVNRYQKVRFETA